ncbi:hypothetical protein D3C79_935140 [compost metagenome]
MTIISPNVNIAMATAHSHTDCPASIKPISPTMKNTVPSASQRSMFSWRMPRLSKYCNAMTMLALTIITTPMILYANSAFETMIRYCDR